MILSGVRLILQGPKILFGKSGILYSCLMVIFMPVFPIVTIMRERILDHASKTYQVSSHYLEQANVQMSQYISADLVLETIFQLFIQTLLLLSARSETRTILGMERLFDPEEEMLFMSPEFLLVISISGSLVSCVRSHMKGISKKRAHSSATSTAVMLLFTLSSIFLRMFSYTLYFTPCLGLFNVLRHLQGEMYPYYHPVHYKMNLTQELFYFGNAKPIPWAQITRWNHTLDNANPTPPQLSLYTMYTIEQYFCMFVTLLTMHAFFMYLAKRFINPESFQRLTLLDALIHSIGNCHIPAPMEEWDDRKGSVAAHKRRQKLVLKEIVVAIGLNFLMNFALLSPLIILFMSIVERHEILVNSIGAFPTEIIAFWKIQRVLGVSYGLLLLFTIVQLVAYYFYNSKYHPFYKIVRSERNCKTNFIKGLILPLIIKIIYIPDWFFEEFEMEEIMELNGNNPNQEHE